MKGRDRKELHRYIRWVADAMELRDWTLVLSRIDAEDGDNGHINLTYGRKLATIRLCSDFRTMEPEQQRHTIVHELVHCHLEPAHNMVGNDLEKMLGKPADQVFYDGFRRQAEYATDALASAIAKHMPLIEWPKKPLKEVKTSAKEVTDERQEAAVQADCSITWRPEGV